jgi:hypothetical protein
MPSQPLASVPLGALLEPRLSRSGERPPGRRAPAEWEKRESVAIDISRVVSRSSATRAMGPQRHFSFRRFQVWPERGDGVLRYRGGSCATRDQERWLGGSARITEPRSRGARPRCPYARSPGESQPTRSTSSWPARRPSEATELGAGSDRAMPRSSRSAKSTTSSTTRTYVRGRTGAAPRVRRGSTVAGDGRESAMAAVMKRGFEWRPLVQMLVRQAEVDAHLLRAVRVRGRPIPTPTEVRDSESEGR